MSIGSHSVTTSKSETNKMQRLSYLVAKYLLLLSAAMITLGIYYYLDTTGFIWFMRNSGWADKPELGFFAVGAAIFVLGISALALRRAFQNLVRMCLTIPAIGLTTSGLLKMALAVFFYLF